MEMKHVCSTHQVEDCFDCFGPIPQKTSKQRAKEALARLEHGYFKVCLKRPAEDPGGYVMGNVSTRDLAAVVTFAKEVLEADAVETTVKCGCGVTLERRLFCPACREAMPFDFASAEKASVDPRNCPQCGPHPNESSDEHTQRRHTFSGLFGESEENGRP